MTRRSIATVLGSLLVVLSIACSAPAVRACETDDMGNCVAYTAQHVDVDYRFIEANTITLPSAGWAVASDGPQQDDATRAALERAGAADYTLAAPQGVPQGPQERVCYDGSAVLLTCYTRQPDGLWQRTEMQEDGSWMVASTATLDELTAVAVPTGDDRSIEQNDFGQRAPTAPDDGYDPQYNGGTLVANATTTIVCPTEPTDRPLCYAPLPDGTKVLLSLRPDLTGQP